MEFTDKNGVNWRVEYPEPFEWQIGDTVYFSQGGEELTEGKVVHIFERYNTKQYVIEVETHIDPYLVVRDWLTTSDTKDGDLFIWRKKWIKI